MYITSTQAKLQASTKSPKLNRKHTLKTYGYLLPVFVKFLVLALYQIGTNQINVQI